MKERTARTTFLVLIGLLLGAFAVSACDFTFNYEEITAPIGTVGQIVVQVQKTHNQCVMDGLDYHFEYSDLQVLEETEWEQLLGPDLYEKWFQVSLSRLGDGEFKIYMDCTKDGYEEAVLPVTVTAGEEDGVWSVAMSGAYPFTDETGMTAEVTTGVIWLHDGVLSVADRSVVLPTVPEGLVDYQGEAYVYTAQTEGESAVLLLVSDEFFYRFDHLIDTEDEDYEPPIDGAGYGYGLGLPGGADEDGVPSYAVVQESHEADPLEPVEEHEEGDGFGRLTVEEICVQHGISVADGLIRLQNYGLEADSTTRIRVLRDLYAASGYDSTDLVHIIQGLELGEHEHEDEGE